MARLPETQLLERFSKAKAHADLFIQLYEDAYTLVVPDREMHRNRSAGTDKAIGVYDSSGMRAGDGFVNRFLSTVCPPYERWAELTAGPAIGDEIRDTLNEGLELITQQVFSAIQSSNFNTAAGEFAYDVGVGTGAMLVLDNDDLKRPFKIVVVNPAQLVLEDNPFGEICLIGRKFEIPARDIKQYYPDAKLPDGIMDDPDKKICFIEVTYHDYQSDTWYYDAIIEDKKTRVVERVYPENPWIILRWSKVPGESFGRGPFVKALPDLKTLNKVREMSLMGLQLSIMGVFTGVSGEVTNVDNLILEPGSIITVDRNSGPNGPSLSPLQVGGNAQIQYLEQENLEMSIRELLYDNRLPPEAGPVKSATEIVERIKQLQTDVGAAFGRIMGEFVTPFIKRIVGIMQRKGLITLPEGMTLDNLFLKVELLSPIARSQKFNDIQAVVNALQIAYSIDPQGQVLPLIYDLEKVHRYIAENAGVPATLIMSEDEAELKKAQIAQVMAVAAQNEQGQQ